MVYADNPAGRLHLILEEARGVSPNTTIRQAWAKVLAVDPEDRAQVLTAMGAVAALPNQIKKLVTAVPDVDTDLYLSWYDDVVEALNHGSILNAKWMQFSSRLTPDVMLGIRHADHLLHRHAREARVAEDRIDEWHNEVKSLFTEIERSDMGPESRRYLLGHLASLDQAFLLHRVQGSLPLEAAVREVLGACSPNHATFERRLAGRRGAADFSNSWARSPSLLA